MSTTTEKRPRARAMQDAVAFRELFPTSCYSAWEFAGSLRRGRGEVSDVEHVVIPRHGEVISTSGLFALPESVNLLWHHLDALLSGQEVSKHIYGTTGFRWGPKYRGAEFRGFNHELFTTDSDGWGSQFAIRTGPPEFSKMLVGKLWGQRRRNVDGYVWDCHKCPTCGDRRWDICKLCDGTGLEPGSRLSIPTEREFFALAGVAYVGPEGRG